MGTAVLAACGVPVLVGVALRDPLEQLLGSWWWLGVLAAGQLALLAVFAAIRHRRVSGSAESVTPSVLEAATRQLARVQELERLLKITAYLAIRYVGCRHASIFLVEETDSARHRLVASHGTRASQRVKTLDADSPLVRWLQQSHEVLCAQDCQPTASTNSGHVQAKSYSRLHLILENLDASLVVPAFQGKQLIGFLVAGPRGKRADLRGPYTPDEIAALTHLVQGCAVALKNARSYEQLKVTARKLHSAQDRLVRQERMVAAGRLTMGLAHEIKNPLAAIKTFTDYLAERYDDPQFRREFITIVSKEVERISRIVGSLGDFAKPLLLKVEPTDVQEIAKETVALLSSDCLKRNITIKQAYEPEPILVPGDAGQLKQAVLNLCMNALDAMPEGGVLSISCQYRQGEAVLRVADTGVGIPKDHLPVLFDPFFTTKGSGMGLGLAMVKQIVEQHFGSITVESQPGAGSWFEVRLPWAMMMPELGEPSHLSTPAPSAAERLIEYPVVPLDILVVDDEAKICLLLKDGFESRGCHVRVTDNGTQALELVRQALPQLLLLDLKLEGLDGFEVLRRVKAEYPKLPVIVITSTYFDDEDVDRTVLEMGAAACFHKPLNIANLHRKVFEMAAGGAIPNGSKQARGRQAG